MSLSSEIDKALILKSTATMLRSLEEAKAEKAFLEEQLATLQDQLKRSRRALKNIIVVGLGPVHEAKAELKRRPVK